MCAMAQMLMAQRATFKGHFSPSTKCLPRVNVKRGSKDLYPRSHLTDPKNSFYELAYT